MSDVCPHGKCTYGATGECDCAQPRSPATELQAALDRCPSVDAKVARHLKVSITTVNRWRIGMSQPHAKAMPAILAALKELTDAV